jgi:hypothetical protein
MTAELKKIKTTLALLNESQAIKPHQTYFSALVGSFS